MIHANFHRFTEPYNEDLPIWDQPFVLDNLPPRASSAPSLAERDNNPVIEAGRVYQGARS